MDSYDGYGSPGRSRDGDSYSYRRRSPGKAHMTTIVHPFDGCWGVADLLQLHHRIAVVAAVVAPAPLL